MPFSSLYSTIFFASVLLIPETYCSNGADAVFKSTPTLFTQSSTTPESVVSNFFWFISCWYWPTPIALGSILTNSANGSCNLLAIDVALLCPTSKLGNSSVASLLAEYTEAPASLTIIYWTFLLDSFIISTITASDSLEAVPLPSEIKSTLYLSIRPRIIFFDSSILFCGAVGKITVVYNTFPVGSTIAILQPVLNAGSHPKTVFPIIGGCINNCFKFCPNTLIAPSSAFSVSKFLISLSIAGWISRLKLSCTASLIISEVFWLSLIIVVFTNAFIIASSGISTVTFNIFSFSPRLIAKILCPGIFATDSLYS